MDATDILIASFSSLSLPAPRSVSLTHQPRFTLFPTLPPELRRKIYSFALPPQMPQAALTLDAKILSSDSRFGLYLLFLHPLPSSSPYQPVPSLSSPYVKNPELTIWRDSQFVYP
jgi:hypothetical protein